MNEIGNSRETQQYIPMNGIGLTEEGKIKTNGLIGCISCVGYFEKYGRNSAFLSHYPPMYPSVHLTQILNFRDRTPHLSNYDRAEIIVFRLPDDQITEGLRYAQPSGGINTYIDNIEIMKQALLRQFPGSSIKDKAYRSMGYVEVDVNNATWKTNEEEGRFFSPSAGDCV
jgi:hypothetical protein